MLFGEHSAVYGYPAVGIPLPSRTIISIKEGGAGFELGPELEEYRPVLNDFRIYLRDLFPAAPRFTEKTLSITTSVPVGAGLGSSAALCAALSRLLLSRGGAGPDEANAQWKLANDMEKYFHGSPSGIDTGLALSDVPLAFYFKGYGLPQKTPLPSMAFDIIYGWVPRKTPAKELIAGVRKQKDDDPRLVKDILSGLGSLAEEFICQINSGVSNPAKHAGELADEAHACLSMLGLSDPELDEVLRSAKRAGAKGGKLSGAGGGGAFWIAAGPGDAAKKIIREIKKRHSVECHIIRA